jgi:hypothetical protein
MPLIGGRGAKGIRQVEGGIVAAALRLKQATERGESEEASRQQGALFALLDQLIQIERGSPVMKAQPGDSAPATRRA